MGLFPVPTLPGSQNPQALSGGPNNSYVIFKTSKYVSQDIKLIEFLTTLQVQQRLVGRTRAAAQQRVVHSRRRASSSSSPCCGSMYNYISSSTTRSGRGVRQHDARQHLLLLVPDQLGVFFGWALSPSSAASSMQSQMQSYLATASPASCRAMHPGSAPSRRGSGLFR